MGDTNVQTVAIGGINQQNTPQLMVKSSVEGRHLDGVAVVSAIMSSTEPEQTCKDFAGIVRQYFSKCMKVGTATQEHPDTNEMIENIIKLIPTIRQKGPLVHHITSKLLRSFFFFFGFTVTTSLNNKIMRQITWLSTTMPTPLWRSELHPSWQPTQKM
jgi:hypothetical protein